MPSSDITFCASDCQDKTCKRHMSFAPLGIKNTSFADLSPICMKYAEKPKGVEEDDCKS
jgi:hypothetical protein